MADAWTFEGERRIAIARDGHGVPHIRVSTESDLYRALGFCHATDRSLALLLLRILAQGRASELLRATDEMLETDRFFRRLDLGREAAAEVAKIAAPDLALLEAYCDGVDRALRAGPPWELRMLGYSPEPWSPEDSILLSRVTGYVALAQSQGEMEHLFVELVQAGVPAAHLEAILPVVLGDDDAALLRRVRLGDRLVPEAVRWSSAIPRAVASNNWAIAPSRTAKGRAILANDPHLDVSRLPAVWYEIVATVEDRSCIAATMPGLPALLLGRTDDLAWGATYTFMDAIDSWVEDCRDGSFRRNVGGREVWQPFRERREVVKRKGRPDHVLVFHENDHGVLDGDPRDPGLYLATRWASGRETGARSLAASFAIFRARGVEEGRAALGGIETAWNWVLADREGHIGYQMSGLMPLRPAGWNGFAPRPGWDPENDWQGFASPEDLPRALDPPEGFLVTANDDLNHLGRRAPIDLPMGSYRAERIAAVLAEHSDWTVEDVQRLQMDDYSLHAERLLEILEPSLPATPVAAVLRDWDRCYDPASRGAALFEDLYRGLLLEIFAPRFGEEVMRFLLDETGIVADFYSCFDRVLFDPASVWYEGRDRDALFAAVAGRVLDAATQRGPLPRWGERQRLRMKHLLYGGDLPIWLGFDRGPFEIRGHRATVHQGQIYRSRGRETSFAPSYRLVADLGESGAHTCLAGGPSDRRFSRWYDTGIEDWLAGRFKKLVPVDEGR